MTPEQLKQTPITVHPNQKLDTEEGESNTDEQEFTLSNKRKMNLPHLQTCQNKILNLTQLLMILKIKKSHKTRNTSHS